MSDGIDINGIQGTQWQNLARKCDANGDGKISGNEVSVWNEARENYQSGNGLGIADTTSVGGVAFNVSDVEFFRRNEEGADYQNTVRFNTGVKLEYDNRKYFGSDASVTSMPAGEYGTLTSLSNFNSMDDRGPRISGTNKRDRINLFNSIPDAVDGRGDNDHVISNDDVNNNGFYNVERITYDPKAFSHENISERDNPFFK